MRYKYGKTYLERLIPLFLILPIALIFFYFIIVSVNPFLAAGGDFISYFTGASIIKDGKGPLIYDFATQSRYMEKAIHPLTGQFSNRYVAPPFVALIYLPFSLFNFFIAYKLFTLFNLGLFLLFIYLLFDTFKNAKKLNGIIILPLYFYSAISTLFSAQTSFILAILVLFLYKLIKGKKAVLVGICTALLLIKPQYMVFAPFIYLLTNGKKKYLLGFFATLLVLLLVSILLVGLEGLKNYPSFVLATENPVFGNRANQMFSLHAVVSNLLFDSNLASIQSLIFSFFGFTIVFYLFLKRYQKLSLNLSFALIILLSLLFSAHVLSHDLILLLIPIFILLDKAYKKKKASRHFLLIFVLILFVIPATISLGSSLIGTILLFLLALVFLFKPSILDDILPAS